MNYSLSTIERGFTELKTNASGIDTKSLPQRREKYGFNELPKKKKSLVGLFFSQFNDVLVYILIGALALSLVTPFLQGQHLSLEAFADAIVISAILLLNAVLGFVQEFKAEEAIAMLEQLTSPQVRVRRDGEESVIESRELVPGDIVILEAGDRISADGRLISISHLRMNESSLTGESLAVSKTTDELEKEAPLADRKNMVFSGTLVSNGSAEYMVTDTGLSTEIGKIAQLVSETKIPETPLQHRMKKLGRVMGAVVLLLCALVFVIAEFHDRSHLEALLIAVSLAVSAVPEGLPAVVTVCFAMGVKRMVKRNALVRRLDSLETLGSVNVICSDKTGTITENRMKVTDVWVPSGTKEDIALLVQVGASCNRAKLPDLGDPTEVGLISYANEVGIERLEFDEEEVPFNSVDKYMQTRHADVSYLKGATEKIIAMCDNADIDAVRKENSQMARKGLRVLACAVKKGDTFTFIGLIGMEDPPRKGVKSAIAEAAVAGIRTLMITGDNIETAKAIAEQVGISGDAIHGDSLDDLSDEQLRETVETTSVYARVSPVHKLRILEALQSNGNIVAMSGDGVNDAPALKGAHVGIAMGKVGTQVAREASSIVLADDHFTTIVSAIREGRRIYDNIRKFVLFLLRANFDEIILIMVTLSLDMPLPYLPIHILWINLMTDGLPALALGLEKAEPDIMKRPPRSPDESILEGEWIKLGIAAFAGFAVSFFFFRYLLDAGFPLEEARTMTLVSAIMFELILAFSVRSRRPVWEIGLFTNKWLVGAVTIPFIAQLFILYTPLSVIFRLKGLTLMEWVYVIPVAMSGFLIFEAIKYFHLPAHARK